MTDSNKIQLRQKAWYLLCSTTQSLIIQVRQHCDGEGSTPSSDMSTLGSTRIKVSVAAECNNTLVVYHALGCHVKNHVRRMMIKIKTRQTPIPH